MWSKFQVKSYWYTNPGQHFYVYFECDFDTANRIFSHQSIVYEHYKYDSIETPIIENCNYRLTDNKWICLYNKEYCEKYVDEHLSFDCLKPF